MQKGKGQKAKGKKQKAKSKKQKAKSKSRGTRRRRRKSKRQKVKSKEQNAKSRKARALFANPVRKTPKHRVCLGDVACNEFPRQVCRNLSRLADVKTALQMSKRSCRCLLTWDLPNRTTQIPKLKSKSASHPGLTLREEVDVKPRREKSSSTPSCGDLQARCQDAHSDICQRDFCVVHLRLP